MKRPSRFALRGLLLLALGLSAGCEASPDHDPCGPGVAGQLDGYDYCVYRPEIVETGFRCPPDRAHGRHVEDVYVCSERGREPPGFEQRVCEGVGQRGVCDERRPPKDDDPVAPLGDVEGRPVPSSPPAGGGADAPRCGDGAVDEGERCDEGEANADTPDARCRADCTPRRCGDGVVDRRAGEACDGEPDCRADCTRRICGDGITDPDEACDGDPDCRADCTRQSCGDGIRDPGEACDGEPDCREDCTRMVCGDGIRDPGEACDAAPDCRADCTRMLCGDGIRDPGEACDGGDDCRRDCTRMVCGDGVLDPGELCDGGNKCRADCTARICGDGILDPGEACDGGAACTDACQRCAGSLGDRVWLDADADGIQDVDEGGLPDVSLRLFDGEGRRVADAVTGPEGAWRFERLCPGRYTVELDLDGVPFDLSPSPTRIGEDEALDSDALPYDLSLAHRAQRDDLDFGLAPCGACRGRATRLTLRYGGADTASLEALDGDDSVFAAELTPGQLFELRPPEGDARFGAEIELTVDGAEPLALRTDCGEPLLVGQVVGDFEVVAGASRDGGLLCRARLCALRTEPPRLEGRELKWRFTHGGDLPTTVRRVEATWPEANGALLEVHLDGRIFRGEEAPPTAVLEGEALEQEDMNHRTLEPGDSKELKLKFVQDVSEDIGAYTVRVDFGAGCEVELRP